MGKTIHGKTKSSLYRCWVALRSRCRDENHPAYKNYGGRGIKVCAQWENDFLQFSKDVGERPSEDYSLDRINNDGNYEPGNVKWSTRLEQTKNSRSSKNIKFNGIVDNIAGWAIRTGIHRSTLKGRFRRGIMSTQECLTLPKINGKRKR